MCYDKIKREWEKVKYIHLNTTKRAISVFIFFMLSLFVFTPKIYADEYNCSEGKHKDIIIQKIEATETADGEEEYRCELCNRSFVKTVYATDHLWSEWYIDKEATCTEKGLKHRNCTRGEGHEEIKKISAQPIAKVQPEEEPFPFLEVCIISANGVLLTFFTGIIISDIRIIQWEKKLRKRNRERLERDKIEFS